MVDVTVYTLDNNEEYILLDKIEKYLFLSNKNDSKDLVIRIDEGEHITHLENEEEVKKALSLFYEKNKDIKLED